MKRYIIKQTEETGSYIRGDNYLEHITIRDNLTKAVSTPSSVKIQIDDECSNNILASTDMTSLGSGVYSYDYAISATARYGKYKITISTTTYTQKEVFYYYVFPWDVEDEVRMLSGVGQNKSISDYALNEIIWEAYQEASKECYEYYHDVTPRQCWTSCSGYNYCINGSNTTFFVSQYIADYDGDGVVKGYGEQSCGTDVDAYWKDCDGYCHQSLVTVNDADCGRLTITQLDKTAIPSTAKGVYISYWRQSGSFDLDLLRIAVMYLAAHKMILRFGELERATSADLTTAQNIKYVDPMRMWNNYKKILKIIGIPNIGGAVYNP